MKKLQEGRSMIEMLGVLAIIGVLSIGGLAGYTMAMNRYRANTLTDYAMRCAVVSQTNGMGTDPTTGDCDGSSLLNENAPGFLGTSGKCTVAKLTGGKDPQDITVTCSTVSDNVDEVLRAKFECGASGYTSCATVGGVTYAAKGKFQFGTTS